MLVAIQAMTTWIRLPACLHQQQHRRQRHAQPAGEVALASLAVEIGACVPHHDPANEGHQQEHRHADRVEPRGQADVAPSDQWAVASASRQHQRQRCDRDAERAERGAFGEEGNQWRATAADQGDDSGGQQKEWCEQWE